MLPGYSGVKTIAAQYETEKTIAAQYETKGENGRTVSCKAWKK